ncbi:MAG: hypothetical protein ABI972_01370 [Acidobacteriota bacterium]
MKLSSLIKTTLLPLAAIYLMLVPGAGACPATSNVAKFNASILLRSPVVLSGMFTTKAAPILIGEPITNEATQTSRLDIIGMWELTQTIDGQLFDHALQQLYTDGNEMQNSSVVPPSLGNTCYGVWERTGNREFKLKHYGWNFDASGNFTGTFFLTATIKMTDADHYTGTFVTDTLMLSGVPDPSLHGEGTVAATRIKLD